jgi:tRNA threonylcarbamoyl adenosine modification protein YjeE
MTQRLDVDSLGHMQQLAQAVAKELVLGDVVLCQGEMGAGKTTFIRSAIQWLMEDAEAIVTSPTFTLVQSYASPVGTIWHYDLFRLQDAAELEELGLDQAMEGICFVEWPEKAEGFFPENSLALRFSYGKNADSRLVTLESPGDISRWRSLTHVHSTGSGHGTHHA